MKTEIEVLDSAGWQAALGGRGVALQQHASYGAALLRLGARVDRLRLLQGGRAVALAQVVRRGPLRLLNRGPVLIDPAVDPRVVLRGFAGRGMIATPESAVSGPGLVPILTPRWQAELDLTGDFPSRAEPKFRAHLRRAEAAGITLRQSCDLSGAGPLLQAEAAVARARGYRRLPDAFLHAWAAEGPLRHWTAWHGKTWLGGMIFLLHAPWATYQMAHVTPEGRALRAGHLTLMRAAQALAAEGITTLDLGSIETDRAPGLARFKLATGARGRALGATCLVLPNLW